MSSAVRTLLIVSSDPPQAVAWTALVRLASRSGADAVEAATTIDEVLAAHAAGPPDVILAGEGNAVGAVELLGVLRSREIDTPVIVLLSGSDEGRAIELLRAGATDCLLGPEIDPAMLRASIRDAAELARLARAQRDAEQRLRESETRHRALIENSHDAIALLDRAGIIRYSSRATTKILGFPLEEFVGFPALSFVHPDDADTVARVLGDCAAEAGAVGRAEVRARHRDGGWRWVEGVVVNRFGEPGIEAMIANFRDVSDRHALEEERLRHAERIRHQAFHDSLTGVPNRALFEDRLNLAIASAGRNGESLYVMFLDLDNFKAVNDTRGHSVGDRVLQVIANRLRGCIRENDSLARIGGDEFVLLLPGLSTHDDAAKVGRKLLRQFQRPFEVERERFSVTASVGIACFPAAGSTPEALLQSADRAMYRAKALGRNRFSIAGADEAGTPAAPLPRTE